MQTNFAPCVLHPPTWDSVGWLRTNGCKSRNTLFSLSSLAIVLATVFPLGLQLPEDGEEIPQSCDFLSSS